MSNHTIEAKQFTAWHQRCEKDERPHITLADVDAVAKRLKAAETCAASACACAVSCIFSPSQACASRSSVGWPHVVCLFNTPLTGRNRPGAKQWVAPAEFP